MKKFIIPILFCLIAHVGFAQKATNTSLAKVSANGTVHYSLIDKAPTLEGCENISDAKQQNTCTEEKIQAYIQKNFTASIARSISANRNIAGNKIYVRFIVNKQGVAENVGVRVSNEQMKAEVERILATLPKFSIGMHQGKAVKTSFTFWLQADTLLRNAAK
ncbi:hypothetical protein [Kordia jejudonensis]|uniref:hypothetical protein n=1 Tax=Kordia jejudonensis TaxID=1348245 RepID=UPI000629517A|nr:hypothetical protein [Kordia jejudonensis]